MKVSHMEPQGPFTFWLVNFGWYVQERVAMTLTEAREIAREIGFEVAIRDADGNLVATWGQISGWREIPHCEV